MTRATAIHAWAAACAFALPLALAAPAVQAEDRFVVVNFQNDLFFGHDGGGYTNGIYASSIRLASPGERRIEPSPLLAPFARWLGVEDATLVAFSFGQAISTPRDLTRRQPDPADAPYAGALAVRAAQVQVHGDVADMAAVSLGVIGPAAGGEQVQRLVHRVVGATRPEGWDSQVSNRPIASLERYRAWRFPLAEGAADFIAIGGGSLGTPETSLGGSLMLRYGAGLERSFPTVARVSHAVADPFVVDRGWFVYASLSGDRLLRRSGVDNEARSGSDPVLRKSRWVVAGGVAYGWGRNSLSFSLQSASPLVTATERRQSYGSLTFARRLD